MFFLILLLFALAICCCKSSAGAAPAGTKIDFSSLDTHHPPKVSGTLYLPKTLPVLFPPSFGSRTMGIDQRGDFIANRSSARGSEYSKSTSRPGFTGAPWTGQVPTLFCRWHSRR